MKLGKALFVLFLVVALTLPTVSAESSDVEEKKYTEVSVNPTLKIKKYSDGRVEGIRNVDALSEKDIDSVLAQMNMTNEEISEVPLALKKQFVSRGGKKVNLTTKVKGYYNSLDGNRYEITENNKEEIEKIREKDRAALKERERKLTGNKVSTLAMDSVVDGKFSAQSYLFLLGETSTEYKYDYYTSYNWSSAPDNWYTDILAHSWQSHTTAVSRNGANNYKLFCDLNVWHNENMSLEPKPGGTIGKIDLQHACNQYGALHDEVRIPKIHKNTTGNFIAGYAHPWVGGIVGVALNYLGIDFTALVGDEWFLDNTFTVGYSY